MEAEIQCNLLAANNSTQGKCHRIFELPMNHQSGVFKSPCETALGLVPHDNDVLCGRGHSTSFHRGNQFFREIIQELLDKYYSQTSNYGKNRIAVEVIHILTERTSPPARFLQENKITEAWECLPTQKVQSKVKQTFRDMKRVEKSRVLLPCDERQPTSSVCQVLGPTNPFVDTNHTSLQGSELHNAQITHVIKDEASNARLPFYNQGERLSHPLSGDEINIIHRETQMDGSAFCMNHVSYIRQTCIQGDEDSSLMDLSSICSFDVNDDDDCSLAISPDDFWIEYDQADLEMIEIMIM